MKKNGRKLSAISYQLSAKQEQPRMTRMATDKKEDNPFFFICVIRVIRGWSFLPDGS
jgi:hypothetical protein